MSKQKQAGELIQLGQPQKQMPLPDMLDLFAMQILGGIAETQTAALDTDAVYLMLVRRAYRLASVAVANRDQIRKELSK
jgi:hypothetical protein